MDKQSLIHKLASALGRKSPDGSPATPQAAPTAPPRPPTPEPDSSDESESIGAAIGQMEPDTPPTDRLIHVLADATAVVERAGEMLEAQAKRQQQLTDALSELSEMVSRHGQQNAETAEAIEHIRADITGKFAGVDDQLERLRRSADRLTAGDDESLRTAEIVVTMATTLEEMEKSVAEGLDSLNADLATLRKEAMGNVARMRRLTALAAILAGGAIVAAFVARWIT